eukprot:365125-Chlamydomonas_euryale.AAC.12
MSCVQPVGILRIFKSTHKRILHILRRYHIHRPCQVLSLSDGQSPSGRLLPPAPAQRITHIKGRAAEQTCNGLRQHNTTGLTQSNFSERACSVHHIEPWRRKHH